MYYLLYIEIINITSIRGGLRVLYKIKNKTTLTDDQRLYASSMCLYDLIVSKQLDITSQNQYTSYMVDNEQYIINIQTKVNGVYIIFSNNPITSMISIAIHKGELDTLLLTYTGNFTDKDNYLVDKCIRSFIIAKSALSNEKIDEYTKDNNDINLVNTVLLVGMEEQEFLQ